MILVIIERAQNTHRLFARLAVETDDFVCVLLTFNILLNLYIKYIVTSSNLKEKRRIFKGIPCHSLYQNIICTR